MSVAVPMTEPIAMVDTSWRVAVDPRKRASLAQAYETLTAMRKQHQSEVQRRRSARTVGPLTRSVMAEAGDERVPFVCLTADQFYPAMKDMFRRDKILEQLLDRMASQLCMGEHFELECLSRLSALPPEAAVFLSKLLTQCTGGALDTYYRGCYRRFLEWYVAMGCVPFAYTPNPLSAAGAQPFNHPAADAVMYNSAEMEVLRTREAVVCAQLFDALSSRGADLVLRDPDFFEKLGILPDIARIVADTFARNPTTDRRVIHGLLGLLRWRAFGFAPHVPCLWGPIDVIYDPCSRRCVVVDETLYVYQAYVANPPTYGSAPDSVGAVHRPYALQFAAVTANAFASAKAACQRVALIAQVEPDASKFKRAVKEKQNTDETAFRIASLLRGGDNHTAARQLLAGTLARGPGAAGCTAGQQRMQDAALSDEALALSEAIERCRVDADGYVRLSHALRLATQRRALHESDVHMLEEWDRRAIEAVCDSMHKNTESSLDAPVHVINAPTNSKILATYERNQPLDVLADVFHTWSAFWHSALTGVNHFHTRRVIEYDSGGNKSQGRGNSTNGFIDSVWEGMVEQCGFPLRNVREVREFTVEETARTAEMISDRVGRASFIARRLHMRPSDIF
ncbi:ORF52 [Ranid herpesvirus 1]|uniref:ORF52 n=1 Tax=Ranid herpesvirus 1 TaxID=85655 RepID=Q14VQ6_9VIRU|nr:ORF52 [Ranid herpesvirus 1]ABG25723.1 ORF52 [Ranid herpesvirus 1]